MVHFNDSKESPDNSISNLDLEDELGPPLIITPFPVGDVVIFIPAA